MAKATRMEMERAPSTSVQSLGAPKALTPVMGALSGNSNHYQGCCRAVPNSMITDKELSRDDLFLFTLNISIVLNHGLSNSTDLLSMGN